jgi:hypothetical protein
MTLPIPHQPNIEEGLQDQSSISLTLFDLILQTAHSHEELHRSWEVIARDVQIREQWEAQQRQA